MEFAQALKVVAGTSRHLSNFGWLKCFPGGACRPLTCCPGAFYRRTARHHPSRQVAPVGAHKQLPWPMKGLVHLTVAVSYVGLTSFPSLILTASPLLNQSASHDPPVYLRVRSREVPLALTHTCREVKDAMDTHGLEALY